MSPPNTPSLQLLSLNVNGLRGKQKRAALFATLQSGPWQVIALQETHHANQTEAAQWCREGAGPTAPWDGPSFWATGTSASRGVALLFKPSPPLSGATSAAVDPNGRFVAVRCDHVVGWAPMRSGQLNSEVHLSFKDASAQHKQQLASTGAIQVTMPGAAAPVSLPVSTVAAKQLPEVTGTPAQCPWGYQRPWVNGMPAEALSVWA